MNYSTSIKSGFLRPSRRSGKNCAAQTTYLSYKSPTVKMVVGRWIFVIASNGSLKESTLRGYCL